LAAIRSIEYRTSDESMARPLENFTPGRRKNVHVF
jgi:hypothetical protein